ncbi:MAG: hypothetical protein WC119_00110 [Synergistaceae bacterium]
MSKIIKTQIDGVPVELEIRNVGPASIDEIQRLSENLAKESSVRNPSSTEVRVIRVGDENRPATPEEVEKIEGQIKDTPVELVGDLIESLSNVSEGKEWWQSKIVWTNIAAIVTAITALFGLPIQINPEIAMVLFPVILGLVNVFLRGKTDKAIKPIFKKN